jgi:hypothetical protein
VGEIADAMLDGTLCETCGEFIGEPIGHPRRCGACDPDDDFDDSHWDVPEFDEPEAP